MRHRTKGTGGRGSGMGVCGAAAGWAWAGVQRGRRVTCAATCVDIADTYCPRWTIGDEGEERTRGGEERRRRHAYVQWRRQHAAVLVARAPSPVSSWDADSADTYCPLWPLGGDGERGASGRCGEVAAAARGRRFMAHGSRFRQSNGVRPRRRSGRCRLPVEQARCESPATF